MISNKIIDEIVTLTEEQHNLKNFNLVEKQVGQSFVKFTYKTEETELRIKYKTSEIAKIVYDNFVGTDMKNKVTYLEFLEKFSTVAEENISAKEAIKKCVELINEEKLFPVEEGEEE